MVIMILMIILMSTVWGHFVLGQSVPGDILSRDEMSPGTLCPPFGHYFTVQEVDISSRGTFCPSKKGGHIVPGDISSRYPREDILSRYLRFEEGHFVPVFEGGHFVPATFEPYQTTPFYFWIFWGYFRYFGIFWVFLAIIVYFWL